MIGFTFTNFKQTRVAIETNSKVFDFFCINCFKVQVQFMS